MNRDILKNSTTGRAGVDKRLGLRSPVRFAVVCVSVLAVQAASAQIVSVHSDAYAPTFSGSLEMLSYDVDASTSLGATTTHGVSGHFTAQWAEQELYGSGTQSNLFTLAIGDLPVAISNVKFSYDGKLVSNSTLPHAYADYSVTAIFAKFDDLNNNGILDLGDTVDLLQIESFFFDGLTGNGSIDLQGEEALAWDTVLEANSFYIFQLSGHLYTVYDSPGDTFKVDIGAPDFDGLQLSYDQQAVPEPGTLALAGLGALAAWRARRKKV